MKHSSFELLRLRQVDYTDGALDDSSLFTVYGNGAWTETFVDNGFLFVSGGRLTGAETAKLSKLFARFDHSAYADGPVAGRDITTEDHYNLDGFARDGSFQNVVYDNGAEAGLTWGPARTADPLDAYMRALDAKYGHGFIL